MQNYRFIISGRVQGVYYRKHIREAASAEGFRGYVKNLSDGRVEACVSMEASRFERFVAMLRAGSPASVVEDIVSETIEEQFNGAFEIRY